MHRRGRSRARRWGTALAVAGIGILLTACGSNGRPAQPSIAIPSTTTPASSPSTESSPPQTGSATPSIAPSVTNSDGTGYAAIGSFTVTSPGARVTTNVEVGQPIPGSTGTPPADVMTSCHWDTSDTVAQAVFIPGRLTVHYTGSIAESVTIPSPSLVDLPATLEGFESVSADIAIQAQDGSWMYCNGDTAHPWGYIMQPGDTLTAAFWINDPALSNAHPRFTTADEDKLGLRFAALGSDQVTGSAVQATVSGPGAANCAAQADSTGTPTLLLYRTPPYRYSATAGGQSYQGECTAP